MWTTDFGSESPLVLEIMPESSDAGVLRFTLRHATMPTVLSKVMAIPQATRELLQRGMAQLVRDPQEAVAAKRFSSLGNLLYRLVLPEEIQAQIAACKGSLIISSQETKLPWELIYDDKEFVCLRRPMARQNIIDYAALAATAAPEPPATPRVLVVADPRGDLPNARREAEQLVALWRDHGLHVDALIGPDEATWFAISEHLREWSYTILHFSSHGEYLVEERTGALALAGVDRLRASDLRKLFNGCPLVFLNVCHSAVAPDAPAGGVNTVPTLVDAFIVGNRGGRARCVVGTSWWVVDDAARDLAVAFYTRLLDRDTVGSSLLKARRLLDDASHDPSLWAPYVLYGDPDVTFDRRKGPTDGGRADDRPKSDDRPKPDGRRSKGKDAASADVADALDHRFADDGLEILLRAAGEMRMMNTPVLSSIHLVLAATHLEGGILSRILAEKRRDPRPIRRALRKFMSEALRGAGLPNPGAGAVSDNVKDILRRAARLDRARGGDGVGEREILAVILDSPKTSAYQTLRRLFDIAPEELRPRLGPDPGPAPDPKAATTGTKIRDMTAVRPGPAPPEWSPAAESALEQAVADLRQRAVELAGRRGRDRVDEADVRDALGSRREPPAGGVPRADDAPTAPRPPVPPTVPAVEVSAPPIDPDEDCEPPLPPPSVGSVHSGTIPTDGSLFLAGGGVDASQFTGEALAALRSAAAGSRRRGRDKFWSPCLFAALVTAESGAVAEGFRKSGFPRDWVDRAFGQAPGRTHDPAQGGPDPSRVDRACFGDDAIDLLRRAREHARGRPIGPEHLLLACLELSEPTLRALAQVGLKADPLLRLAEAIVAGRG